MVGTAGGEHGVRGLIDAFDVETGERRWRFCTVPGPGEFGNDTWSGDSWKTGGASIWISPSYDPELNLVYWGVGNPGPDWNPDVRLGDNLYSDSVVALDADTGKRKWHFQFTPHDVHDWDATQVTVLIDREDRGVGRKLLVTANRNGFIHMLDRETGECLKATQLVKQTWAARISGEGRPIRWPGMEPSAEGIEVYPAVAGGTNSTSISKPRPRETAARGPQQPVGVLPHAPVEGTASNGDERGISVEHRPGSCAMLTMSASHAGRCGGRAPPAIPR